MTAFTKHDDGTVTVDHFDTEILVNEAFMRAADPSLVQWDGDVVTIIAANGSARYAKTRDLGDGTIVMSKLVDRK